MLPKHLTQIQFPQQIESLPAKPLSAQFKWWKEERRGIITKLQNSFGSRAHVVGLAGHHHQTDPWTAGWAWGTWTAQPHHSPVQNQQGQGTRGSPKLTNTFCSTRLDESCFQAPLLALPGNNTLKDLRATGEHSKSEHVCTITPLLSTHQHCRKHGGKHGCASWRCTQTTPSRSSRNFHSLLQQHCWCLLESNGRWLELARPN